MLALPTKKKRELRREKREASEARWERKFSLCFLVGSVFTKISLKTTNRPQILYCETLGYVTEP